MSAVSHTRLRETIRERIISGEWTPGALIPTEEDIAEEYKCSRTTVNRALQALAEAGLIERKRGAGTRVTLGLVKRAQFDIAIVRREIEATGAAYSHRVVLNETRPAPGYVTNRLHLRPKRKAVHLQTVHLTDRRPYAFEDRWVNLDAAPGIADAPLDNISANEWLVREVPYSSGEISFTAEIADGRIAEYLETSPGAAVMCMERTTWLGDKFVTTMKLFYKQGYALRTTL